MKKTLINSIIILMMLSLLGGCSAAPERKDASGVLTVESSISMSEDAKNPPVIDSV